ncbi:hypothetical protein [Amycolatopsis keratiniphila]|uniref:hypothetical protein n=1 Tax=Amycolatopsis keratiniphila TaxID=129921 RepID=UPI0008798B3C|nr:hypothetical protein [Amycolatopsis keratiniphila]OLZ59575.1 hypothetical protein BS330_04070 [Amycolatopsis keratiniphila subsp. nogabecina]SDU53995.1 hypothetical protein SAMN04489733_5724 [Amycolatopsis keratiniphila]
MELDEAEYEAAGLMQTWAEALLRQAERHRSTWQKVRLAWDHYDRDTDEGPDREKRSQLFRELWADSHLLVWTAHQLELWVARLAKERGEAVPAVDPHLKVIRDVLEHLNEAEFRNGYAVPGRAALEAIENNRAWKKQKWKGLLQLPGKELSTGLLDNGTVFELLEPTIFEAAARRALDQLDEQRMDRARDQWIESQED